ncbi:hypothetical protein L6R52_36300 [Myxococcota bacterium]|nr:hypothetical protein [Myxococcota bacterium]
MKTSTTVTRSLIVLGALTWAAPARAQLWNPLDTVPKPNAILGQDTSVTMGIEADCSSCHGAGDPRTRLDLSKYDIVQTLPLFRDYFVWGAFEYSGCDYAKIVGGTRILPTPANPTTSYNQVLAQLNAAEHCGSSERRFPAGTGSSGCITGSYGCSDDLPVIQALLNGGLSGLDPLLPWSGWSCQLPALQSWCPDCAASQSSGGPCHWSGTAPNLQPDTWADINAAIPTDPALTNISTCTNGFCSNPIVQCDGGGSYQVQAALISKLQNFAWPRWYDGNVSPGDVRDDLCDPLRNVFQEVSNEMRACSSSRYVLTPDLNGYSWCNPGRIANNACSPGSPFYGTCVCDNSDPMCQSGARVTSSCGNTLTWKARQQVAVCETYDTSAPDRFGTFFRSQADNVVNPGGCRENVAMFFTDGYMGGTAGVTVEALSALPTFTSYGGRSNMFVFRVADSFRGDANQMMRAVTRGQVTQAYSATDLVETQVSFARVLNRVYKGVYSGAAMGTDTFGTRVAFHSFTVPGNTLGAPISDDYLGWPARISWHAMNPNGTINPNPIFETDWQAKVNGTGSCGRYTPAGGLNDVARLGPGGSFRNGINRYANIAANSFDRNGDNVADNHPALRFGAMFSTASTRPVIVEGTRLVPDGPNATALINFTNTTRARPRMVYVMSNGYLHGYEAGRYVPNATTTFGTQRITQVYDDAGAGAGVELFRFAPNWVDDARPGNEYDYGLNDLVQQPMITGQLVASDQYVRIGATDQYRTVLVGAQGKTGRGVFAFDVSDPCSARLLAQWVLPNPADTASNEPAIYTMRMTTGLTNRPVVMMTGGVGGTNNLYAHDLTTGALLSQVALPGGADYPTAPVCADVTGEGAITHCYVVRRDGRLVRVQVRPNGFGAVHDITPAGVGGGGLVFSTTPAVFFGPDGAINLVYASGDYANLTVPGGQNYAYKIVDTASRRAGVPAGQANVAAACSGASTSGIIPLAPGERVISPPVVSKGVVAWTTYTAGSSGCVSGNGALYAMKYDTCENALGAGNRPTPVSTGAGIPSSPVLHRPSERFLVGSSAGPTAAQTISAQATTRGGRTPALKRLYWRPELQVR